MLRMTERFTICCRKLQRFVWSTVLLLCCQLPMGEVCVADDTADPYNVLYDVIMARKDSEGNAYSKNEVGPLIYGRSKFPFDDETYPKLTKALVGFNALPQEKIESYGTVKRALLQRHLWVVFDATIPNDYKPPTHMERRRASQRLLATLIRRVALTKAEILTLPDTRAATMKNGRFPQEHAPTDSFKPFLPVDLYAKVSSWVCLGKVGNPDTNHARIDRWRSMFLQFVRLPGGRKATLEYIEKLNDREAFPVGTQFALIDQAFLISDQGEIVLSPVINSIESTRLPECHDDSSGGEPHTNCLRRRIRHAAGTAHEGEFPDEGTGTEGFSVPDNLSRHWRKS